VKESTCTDKKPQLSLRNPRDVMFARYLPSNYRVTLKLGVGVNEGHRKCHHSIALVWFRVRLLYQLWPYLAPFPRYADLFVKICPVFSPL